MHKHLLLISFFTVTLLQTTLEASSRKTPWLYGARTMAPGELEYEQWITFKTNKASDSQYEEWRFRHELEYGLTDKIQLAFYFADWRHKRTASSDHTSFRDMAFEGIFQLQAPNPDQLGVALYGEIKHGSDFIELEGKLLIELELDETSILYNLTIEAEWEGQDYSEDKGKIVNSIGLAYQPDPSITYALQALWEVPIPDWDSRGDSVVSIGPSVAYQKDEFWFTVSPLFQVTDVVSAPDLQVRLLFGFHF